METKGASPDQRIPKYIQITEELSKGNFNIEIPLSDQDDVGRLGAALRALAKSLETRYRELQKLNQLTSIINSGLLLEEILEQVYADFQAFIPYDRIGFALLENDGEVLTARWAKTEYKNPLLGRGYMGLMEGSSLADILASGQPRIINDLELYLQNKPESESTQLVVKEGIRSSLTCPLIANGVPVGFMFFSSRLKNTYETQHIDVYLQIAGQLSVIVEKGRLVSELASQKMEIEQHYNEVRRLNELQNTFMGIAAHDLRNPIASIQSVADLLLMPDLEIDPVEQRDFLLDIRDQTQHMLSLLNDLLDVTRIESGKFNLDLIYTDMYKMLDEAVRRNSRLAEPKGTQVILEYVPEGKVLADPSRVRQVLDNLISNAVKYSPPNSTVRVRSQMGEYCWRVEVQDEGPGIQPKDRERLFQDFARLSARPTGGEKSTGLGLSITRRVIEAHGGEIGVDSEPGSGSTFWFTLPNTNSDMGLCGE
ncbi:MAG: hypothetical protein CL609_03510 [Anaerolineaceae bacterium]|nr:hypothetical protein [Anaerolineaceae bacterium]